MHVINVPHTREQHVTFDMSLVPQNETKVHIKCYMSDLVFVEAFPNHITHLMITNFNTNRESKGVQFKVSKPFPNSLVSLSIGSCVLPDGLEDMISDLSNLESFGVFTASGNPRKINTAQIPKSVTEIIDYQPALYDETVDFRNQVKRITTFQIEQFYTRQFVTPYQVDIASFSSLPNLEVIKDYTPCIHSNKEFVMSRLKSAYIRNYSPDFRLVCGNLEHIQFDDSSMNSSNPTTMELFNKSLTNLLKNNPNLTSFHLRVHDHNYEAIEHHPLELDLSHLKLQSASIVGIDKKNAKIIGFPKSEK